MYKHAPTRIIPAQSLFNLSLIQKGFGVISMSAETSSAQVRYVDNPALLDYLPDANPTWLRPVACQPVSTLQHSLGQGRFLPLAGGWTGFTELEVITRKAGRDDNPASGGFTIWRTDIAGYESASADKNIAEGRLSVLSQPRPDFAGMDMTRPHIMGVVNITPDSFSDGGQFNSHEGALAHALRMQADGASLVDIGGESTRPGAAPVSLAEERSRILPVISALAEKGHIISADTRHAKVMDAAITAGAQIINDVSGFTGEGALQVMGQAFAARPSAVFGIAMHMQGEPDNMQDNPVYNFAPIDIYEALKSYIDRLVDAGLPRSHIVIDPGFGFGKTPAHNRQLIAWTSLFHGLGVPISIGVSRKSSIPVLAAKGLGAPPSGFGRDAGTQRLGGGIALSVLAAQQGAQLFRTHDVPETLQALSVVVKGDGLCKLGN